MRTQNRYSEQFKANLVRRVCAPGGPSAYSLAKEVGVSQSALYLWLNQARGTVVKKNKESSSAEAESTARRPQDWTAAEKLAAVVHCGTLGDDELGRYLRERGLHEEQVREWRRQCEESLNPRAQARRERELQARERELQKDNRRLNSELLRKERALAEAAALLVLSKKARALWGEEGENT